MITQEKISARDFKSLPVSTVEVLTCHSRVLLVEDDRSLRRYLEVVLRREGYDVTVAADGLEAMRATLTAPVDLVVTDAIMPNLNGFELVRFLRRTPQLSHIPIVLLSALENPQAQNEEHRANIYLSKPVSAEELIDCLETLISERAS
jgi:CheY-like chemotaxis protein